jgi:hypothetical protein
MTEHRIGTQEGTKSLADLELVGTPASDDARQPFIRHALGPALVAKH